MAIQSATFKFQLNKMHIDFQRTKDEGGDVDSLAITPPIGLRQFPGVETVRMGVSHSGDDLQPPRPGEWETGEIIMHPGQTLVLAISVWNSAHTEENKRRAEALKAASAIVTLIGIAIEGAKDLAGANDLITQQIAQALQKIGQVFSSIGELVGIFGESPNCNGPVFVATMTISFEDLLGRCGNPHTGANFPVTGFGPREDEAPLTGFPQFVDNSLCGHNPQARITSYTVVCTDVFESFTSATTKSLTIAPVAGARADAWNGSWGEQPFRDNCRLVCDIAATGAATAPPASAKAGSIEHRLAVEGLAPGLVARSSASTGGTSIPSVGLQRMVRHRVDSVEHLGGPGGRQLFAFGDEGLFAATLLAEPFIRDAFPVSVTSAVTHQPLGVTNPSVSVAPPEIFNPNLIGTVSPPGGARFSPIAGVGATAIATELFATSRPQFADSLVLSPNVTLQLYGEFDERHRLIRHRVRYLRTDQRGTVVTDAMLRSTVRPPQ